METETPIKKNNKCEYEECNKKLKLTDLSCKCKKRFCIIHRHAETHKCSFNYKDYERNILSSKLIKCSNDKMIKI